MRWHNMTYVGIRVTLAAFLALPTAALATDMRAKLEGYQEVPSVSTDATGTFRAKLMRRADEIVFKLAYAGIETPTRFAHIHFAERHVNGGIVVWLCDNTGNAPAGVSVEPCPVGAGTVEGVITPDDVSGAPERGIDAGDFRAVVEAINAGAAYVNVHSEAFPGGEIRGQIRGWRGDGNDDPKHHDGEDH